MNLTANIIGWDNGGGLTRDIQILEGALSALGCTLAINGRSTRSTKRTLLARALGRARRQIGTAAAAKGLIGSPFDLNLHLEDINREFIPLGKRNVLIPNQEWFPDTSQPYLSAIDEVWAKTRLAEQLFSRRDCKVRFLGWMGNDRRIRSAPPLRYLRGLHIAGSSLWKGTEAVLDVWNENPGWPMLTVLRRTHGYDGQALPWRARAPRPNIEIVTERVDEELLKTIQNSNAIHVCPSEAEGFGHVILESMSVGAVTITTDAPPMNEMISGKTGLLVAAERSEPMHFGQRYFVNRADLAKSIATALHMSDCEREALGEAARAEFDANNAAFLSALQKCLGPNY